MKTGKIKNFSWITDITLSRDNVYHVMRAGRSRWKVENETFNTLKNLGYNFDWLGFCIAYCKAIYDYFFSEKY